MIFKFDILFRKHLSNGGLKVVTYRSLMDNPKAFGANEDLSGATGELSIVREGADKGLSLNGLMWKYNSMLVGRRFVEIFGKSFPLQFTFTDPEDVSSIQALVSDEEGNTYSSISNEKEIRGEEVLNLKELDSFVIIIPKDGNIEIKDEMGNVSEVTQGEVAFVTYSTNMIVIDSRRASVSFLIFIPGKNDPAIVVMKNTSFWYR